MKPQYQSDIYNLIKKYPQQFELGFRIAEIVQITPSTQKFKEVIISTTSYNATIAQSIKDLFSNIIDLPITIHQDYDLPHTVGPDSLIIVVSLCGKREEMLSAARMAYTQKAKIVTITTGGELEVFARERALPLILLDKTLPEFNPLTNGYMSGGCMVAILIQILIKTKILPVNIRQQVLATEGVIEKMYLPKLGQKLAELVTDTTLLIYSPAQYRGVTQLIKNLVNNLLQSPCFYQLIPAVLHSEINSFQSKSPTKYFTLILNDTTLDNRLQKNILTLETKLTTLKIKSYNLELPGENQLEKTLASIMLIYWMIYWSLSQQK